MAEAVGDGDVVEGREIYEVEDQALERSERGEMCEVVLEKEGIHQLRKGIREPQHTRVRSDLVRPWGDRLAPILELVLARE